MLSGAMSMAAFAADTPMPDGGSYHETVGEIEWEYSVAAGEACVDGWAPAPTCQKNQVDLVVPAVLGGCPVVRLGEFSLTRFMEGMRTVEPMSVVLPQGLRQIDAIAFYMTYETSLTIPSTVTNIVPGAFYAAFNLNEIILEPGNENYVVDGGVLYTRDRRNVVCCPAAKPFVTLCSTVTNICDYAFGECRSMTELTLPQGVKRIGGCAFYSCHFEEFRIPAGVTCVENVAFTSCQDMKRVVVPKSLREFKGSTFTACKQLSEMVFEGDAPTVISRGGTDLFWFVPSTCKVTVYKGTKGWDDDGDGKWCGFDLNYIGMDENEARAWVGNSLAANSPQGADEYRARFEAKFGNDYSVLSGLETGKLAADGNPLCLWHDYVSGTDPLDGNSCLRTTIRMGAGNLPIIGHEPVLGAEEAAKRRYRYFGKTSLRGGGKWVEIPAGHESEYHFFKTVVEMK